MRQKLSARFRRLPWWGRALVLAAGGGLIVGSGLVGLYLYSQWYSDSNTYIHRWFNDPKSRAGLTTIQRQPCPGAPFLLPSDGLIGLLYRDTDQPYNLLRRHTGLDIFGDGDPGEVPVYAAYEGYLTRLDAWKATVIIRHDDPLHPGSTIWTYYTHMASKDGDESYVSDQFPPGTSEVWVDQGTLLGYQGEYSGNTVAPVGMHVHISLVRSESDGSFKNESRSGNTLDPSPYFGMELTINSKPDRPIHCGG
jgi:hypothetical protein